MPDRMAGKRLFWYLLPAFQLVLLCSLVLVIWFVSQTLRDFYLAQTEADLLARARLIAHQVRDRFEPDAAPWIDELCKILGAQTGSRITVVLADGRVLGDSDQAPRQMSNHASRPEIVPNRSGEIGRSVRYSHSVNKSMMYVALPVLHGEDYQGSVRVSVATATIEATLRQVRWQMLSGGALIGVLISLFSWWLSRRISRPLEEMKQGVERFARGELETRLQVGGSEEIRSLAEAMNRMAGELNDRIHTVLRQRNEIEAVLASMVEGVLAVDVDDRLLRLNRAAGEMLGISPQQAVGRPVQEVIRKVDLQRFIATTLASRQPVEQDLVLRGARDRYLQAHGTRLLGSEGRQLGALIVLNDITRLRRLETIRSDFVANVSHELKTPITAIKGFVETLLDGALEEPEEARRFLGIVMRQAERLNAIIEDLLDLSRIEQESDLDRVPLAPEKIGALLGSARQICLTRARQDQVRVRVECPEDLVAEVNAALLEQAVTNLIDNAIKYSPADSEVTVSAEATSAGLEIRVVDRGCGIAEEHLSRLFERFYRVDKARSRKLGGTGLGLAIVKHIIQAHGGEVGVQSTPGQGSVFSLRIPSPHQTV